MTPLRRSVLAALLAPLAATAQLSCLSAQEVGLGVHAAPQVVGEAPTLICAGPAQTASAGLWYRFVPNANMSVTVSSHVQGYPDVDTRMHVYTGSCGALTCYSGGDDEGPGFTSIASFTVTAGTIYYIAWDSFWSASPFTFSIEAATPSADGVVFTSVNVPGISSIQGAVDMNDDGMDDLVAPGYTSFSVAYQGTNGAFSVVSQPTPPADNTASWSFAVGDWDSNGRRDLLYGGGSGATFMTANADGTAYTEFSPPQYIFSQRTNFVDLNNDGLLDAFVCHDVDANVAFINTGNSSLSYTQGGYGSTCGNYGSIFTDIDNDCDMDLFVAKCGCDPQDLLMLNNGSGAFTDIAPGQGLADGHQSWSSAWGDFDNDGDMDVLIGSSSNPVHKLLFNNGNGTFTNAPPGNGMDTWSGTSIEWAAHDFNNDGWIDIIGGGAIHYNNGDGTFSHDVNAPGNHAVGDLNNDGFLDIAHGSGYRRNNGNGNNWIRINPRGTASNRDAIGARVTITSASGTQIRDVRSGDGFRYMSFIGAHFGLGADTEVMDVTIRWPNCTTETFKGLAINTAHTIVQGITTAVQEPSAGGFSVWPSPVLDELRYTGAAPAAAFEIIDARGRVALAGRAEGGRIAVAGLGAGPYMLRMTEPQGTKTARFLKE